MLDLLQQLLQLVGLLRQRILLPHQRHQFQLEVCVQSADHQLDSVSYFANLFVLCTANGVDILLDVLHQTDQLHQATLQL